MAYKQISPMAIIEGGTNTDTFVDTNGTVIFDGTKLVTVFPGTVGQVFTSGGASAPSFQDFAGGITTLDADTGSAVGPIVNVIGAGSITTSATGSTLTITGTDNEGIVTLNADSGSATGTTVSIVGSGSITTSATGTTLTIAAGPSEFEWLDTTGATQAMVVAKGYVDNGSGSPTIFTLPATAAVGQRVAVQGSSATLWQIAQNSGQTIHFGVVNTTTGVGGSLAATDRYDAIFLMCNVANTDFVVQGVMGNITYV